jgi:cytochrome c oxidase cbb3-type subunit 3
MSSGWSLYIAIFAIINIVACLWLLWWTSKRRPEQPSATTEKTTGHQWDGISEYNRPLPRWWLNLFYLTIVFAFAYLAFYPGLGNFAGSSGWTSAKQHDAEAAAADAKLQPLFAAFRAKTLPELIHDPEAQRLGRAIFANNCTTCHGSDAKGAKGFPNLTDQDWIWGGAPETVLTTILHGRQAAMPAWGAVLGADGAAAAAVYVQSLSGQSADPTLVATGRKSFQTICAACHGPEGRGNPLLGAPNLTDNIWLYGGDFQTIQQTIINGRNGQMPAHQPLIGEDRVRLAAAWVLAQSAAAPTGAGGQP